MLELSFKDWLLEENVHDKYMFHAVILSGGPGSGKSWLADNLLRPIGFQKIDSDDIIRMLQRDKLAPPSFNDPVRAKSYQMAILKARSWQSIGRPFVIDITGRQPQIVSNIKKELINSGYDVFMVFVDTDLEVALKRNKERPRVEPDEFVSNAWKSAQLAKKEYRAMFGSKYYEIDNNQRIGIDRKVNSWTRDIQSLLGPPYSVENPIGQNKLKTYYRVDKSALNYANGSN